MQDSDGKVMQTQAGSEPARASWRTHLPAVPFGPAPLLILCILLCTSILVWMFPVQHSSAALRFWIFAINHQDAYVRAIGDFARAHAGTNVECLLVDQVAVSRRLQAAFTSGVEVPDMVEVSTGETGNFFRGPLDDVGFWDITERVHASGLYDRMVTARFSTCSSRGRIFGLPHDVHPVMIAYRRDIFEQEGISADEIETWDDFVRVGRRLTKDLDGDGIPDRYMIDMDDAGWGHYEMLLLQAGGGFFDEQGTLTMDSDIAVTVMCALVRMVAGPERISNTLGSGQILTQAMQNDYFVCLFCPDWRTKLIEQDMPGMRGKLALMPLPAWRRGGPRTSTWGGTMLGITAACKDKELAWQFAVHLYCKADDLAQRFRDMNIIPPLRDSWADPVYDEPRPFWSGQPIGRLFCALADEVPPLYVTPFLGLAHTRAGEALVESVRYYQRHGERGLAAHVQKMLSQKAADVRKHMARNPYQ